MRHGRRHDRREVEPRPAQHQAPGANQCGVTPCLHTRSPGRQRASPRPAHTQPAAKRQWRCAPPQPRLRRSSAAPRGLCTVVAALNPRPRSKSRSRRVWPPCRNAGEAAWVRLAAPGEATTFALYASPLSSTSAPHSHTAADSRPMPLGLRLKGCCTQHYSGAPAARARAAAGRHAARQCLRPSSWLRPSHAAAIPYMRGFWLAESAPEGGPLRAATESRAPARAGPNKR